LTDRSAGPARLLLPAVAWDGGAWTAEPGLRRLESLWSTSPTADFDVRIAAPSGLRVLVSGEQLGEGRWRAVTNHTLDTETPAY
jgi:hypothetical protein